MLNGLLRKPLHSNLVRTQQVFNRAAFSFEPVQNSPSSVQPRIELLFEFHAEFADDALAGKFLNAA